MKNLLLPILFTSVILTSCSSVKYFYTTVKPADDYASSINTVEIYDTSTLKNVAEVNHFFTGENGSLIIEIFNNTDEPLYVDWSKSALIANNTAQSYKSDNINVSASMSGTTYFYSDGITESYGGLSGNIHIPTNASFIPPNSKISHSPVLMSKVYYPNTTEGYTEARIQNVKAKSIYFSERDTPLHFRSYITLVNESNTKRYVAEKEFYISDILVTKAKPKKVEQVFNNNHTYYTMQSEINWAKQHCTRHPQ